MNSIRTYAVEEKANRTASRLMDIMPDPEWTAGLKPAADELKPTVG
jgi:hypothetical protein